MEQLAGTSPPASCPGSVAGRPTSSPGARTGDLLGYLQADQQFHLQLTGLLGNPVLVEVVADLRSRARLVGLAAMVKTGRLEDARPPNTTSCSTTSPPATAPLPGP